MPLVCLSLAIACPNALAAATTSASRGDALFHGAEKLSGMIRGHDEALPPAAVICANCHEAGAGLSETNVPRISRALLLNLRPRHGGPPSRYDQLSFCRLLRSGSDPATVLVSREMPIYSVSDDQCASLWRFLTTQGHR